MSGNATLLPLPFKGGGRGAGESGAYRRALALLAAGATHPQLLPLEGRGL